jgi:hypothetical protein
VSICGHVALFIAAETVISVFLLTAALPPAPVFIDRRRGLKVLKSCNTFPRKDYKDNHWWRMIEYRDHHNTRTTFLYSALFSFSMKEYFDEVADIASIFLFACFICDLMLVNFFYGSPSGILHQIKNPSTAGMNSPPLKLALSRAQFLTPILISCFTVLVSLGVSFAFLQEQSAVNFFKNSLDEVADVCSILTVALALFFGLRDFFARG